MELIAHVGKKIREFRSSHGGRGISQEELAIALEIATNTVSRWETGTYRPSLEDLDALSRFFKVSILEFFPKKTESANEPVNALLRAARDLPKEDVEELRKYAEFRKARVILGSVSNKKKAGRPQNKD
jgi:transcriptional regulator with XRE-family HTH domain